MVLCRAADMWRQGKKRRKYGNKKCVYQGITFDSRKEMARYIELSILQRTGAISGLELQPYFTISKGGIIDPATGRKMAARKYYADFKYLDEEGRVIVEDVKSTATAKDSLYRLKRQLFLEQHGEDVVFREV